MKHRDLANTGSPSTQAIPGDQALTIAQVDAVKVYGDLSPYRIHSALEDDGWHVDDLKDARLKDGGPHYVIDAYSGAIRSKKYRR
jgi:hypothetical protein